MFKNLWEEVWSNFDNSFKAFDKAFDSKPDAPVTVGIAEVRLVFAGDTKVSTVTMSVNGAPHVGECLIQTRNPEAVVVELRRVADLIEKALAKK